MLMPLSTGVHTYSVFSCRNIQLLETLDMYTMDSLGTSEQTLWLGRILYREDTTLVYPKKGTVNTWSKSTIREER
jgi:hypothetical protein